MAGVWINEFHYDNSSTDTGEFVEIAAAAGTDLTGWTIVLYNGANGLSYSTRSLTGLTVQNQQNGFGTITLSYPTDGIQNGAPDGIALVNAAGQVVEFISYEGTMTASNGPALGMTSTPIVPIENGSQPGTSIGRIGSGDESGDFSWALITDDTPGGVNNGQTFGNVVVDRPGAFSVTDAIVAEGNTGTTPITFTVSRGSDSNVAASVSYTITLPGGATGASAADFAAPILSGTLSFAANEVSKTITLSVAGDIANEADESFSVTLTAPTNGATLADGTGTGTIVNDDAAVGPGVPFVNEIHYDNAGNDSGEAIEIAGPAGTSLTGWSLVLYSVSSNATVGTTYGSVALSGIVPDQDDGYGTLTFPVTGLQNGAQDGFALVNPQGEVVQFLSYEGAFTAGNGPAAGLVATDIGVAEGGTTPLGLSLQLTGSGASVADFTWTEASPSSFGGVNAGQDFLGANATGRVSVGDTQVVEGDSGTSLLVFTVQRAGGLGQTASVDWLLELGGGTAPAAASDLGAGQPLSGSVAFGAGVSSVTVSVAIAGDTAGEASETLRLLLANPAGNITIADSAAVGTIVNDDPIPLAIYEIQGEGHRSDYVGQPVSTTGIVTGVLANGFFLQDAAGDGNARTSDAVFVFTDSAPAVAVGDAVEVKGKVGEFVGGTGSLSNTEIEAASVVVQTHGNALPGAVTIGAGGVLPPSETIDDDGLTSYDPATDGIDFYESLEGMRVTIDAPLVVAPSSSFGETWVVASGGAGATGVNDRGGITISDGDYNPEKIQIDATPALFDGYQGGHSQGDRLSDVTGILSYGFGSYEVLVTEAVTVTDDVTLGREEDTTLVGDRDHLTIASYNVENLDVGDEAEKFELLAQNIVYSLQAPDIIALQEVQDADGAGNGADLSGQVTAQALIDAIEDAGGPTYVYVEIAPATAGSSGGEPGGNIRNGYLYNADRVSYVEGSAALIQDPAYDGTRKPLVADFTFNGETVRLINVHFTSRGGSDPLWGANQPPADAGDAARAAQGAAVAAYVNDALADDPSLNFGVMGDFNGFWFEDNVTQLEEDGVLTNLHRLLPEEERYSYMFDGNLQALDNFLVSGGLFAGAEFDAVHINAELPDGDRATDHDPTVGRFYIEHPNEAPTAVADSVAVNEDAATGNLWGLLLGNDEDPDTNEVLSIAAVNGSGTLGSLVFDEEAETLVYVADDDTFDALAPGATATDSFTYTVTDEEGLTSTGTVTVTVTGVADGVDKSGGNGADLVRGGAGEDNLSGGNGTDLVYGEGGHDWLAGDNGADDLFGGDGHDVLIGGNGSDALTGGAGRDLFVFGKGGGSDVVLDYEAGVDSLVLEDGVAVKSARALDLDRDGDLDLTIAFSGGGGSVTLYDVASLGDVSFSPPEVLGSHPAI